MKQHLLNATGPYPTHEPTAAALICLRPSKEQASQHSSMEGGRAQEPRFLTEEL